MKTSNKILLGLIIVVFAVPLLIAASLKNKVEKGEHTVEKFENAVNEKLVKGSFQPFKVVKVVAPKTELLTCRLRTSDRADYSYYKNGGNDSVKVVTVNDTLVIQYIPSAAVEPGHDNRDWERAFELSVNLPAFNNLLVDGAVVIVDSLPAASNNISVNLKNGGELKGANSGHNGEDAGISRSADLKKGDAIITSKANKAEVIAAAKNAAHEMFDGAGFKRLDVRLDLKDMLVYNLLDRI